MSIIDELQKDLQERGSDYGPFHRNSTVFCSVHGAVMDALEINVRYGLLSYEKRCLIAHGIVMIATKLARIATGDPQHHDSWKDIAGYVNIVDRDLTALTQKEKGGTN